jgi:hypothetical protein
VAVSRSSGKPAASSATGSTGGCTGRPPRPRQAGWPPSGRCCTARTGRGAAEIARHRLPVPGSPQIYDEHYPHHPGGNGPRQPRPRPPTEAEAAFLAIGDGAQRSLAEAAASGAVRIGSKMARAAELAAVVGADKVDAALGPPGDAGGTMTLRQPHQDAFLAAGDAARMRQVLVVYAQLLSRAEASCGPQFAAAAQEIAEAADLSRAPALWAAR